MDIVKQKKVSDEVYHALADTFSLSSEDVQQLINLSSQNVGKKARLCVHPRIEDPVHQMFIAHKKGTYVRPHKHANKNESMLILQGRADYVVFNERGDIDRVIPMGDYSTSQSFFMSIAPGTFHCIFIRSEWLLFFEVVEGPFIKDKTIFPDWSPTIADVGAVTEFMGRLESKIQELHPINETENAS